MKLLTVFSSVLPDQMAPNGDKQSVTVPENGFLKFDLLLDSDQNVDLDFEFDENQQVKH